MASPAVQSMMAGRPSTAAPTTFPTLTGLGMRYVGSLDTGKTLDTQVNKTDFSGNAKDTTQATASARPYYRGETGPGATQYGVLGKRFWGWGGASQALPVPTTQYGGSHTIGGVIRFESSSDVRHLWGNDQLGGRQWQLKRLNATQMQYIGFNNIGAENGSLTFTHPGNLTWFWFTVVVTPTTVTAYIDGTSAGSVARTGTPAALNRTSWLGADMEGTNSLQTYSHHGQMAEIWCQPEDAITAQNRTQWDAYVQDEYGLGS